MANKINKTDERPVSFFRAMEECIKTRRTYECLDDWPCGAGRMRFAPGSPAGEGDGVIFTLIPCDYERGHYYEVPTGLSQEWIEGVWGQCAYDEECGVHTGAYDKLVKEDGSEDSTVDSA